MEKKKEADWFDILSYLVITVFIVIFILVMVRKREDLILVLMCLVIGVCVFLTMVALAERKQVLEYRALKKWMSEADLDDPEALPPELQEEMEAFLQALQRRYSYGSVRAGMEYSALQNQINPHFLYNTLDGIRSQALLHNETEIADMVGKLSRFFRYSIKQRGDLVTLEEELQNVEDYFSIQQYRFEDRFSLEIQVEQPEARRYYLPKMTFQPILENAIFHGLEPRKEKGRLLIKVELQEKSMRILIRDNGVGMDDAALLALRRRLQGDMPEARADGKRTGIAMYNVNKRLQILFGSGSGLQIESVPGLGTDVEIRLPLVDEENRSVYLALVER